MKSKAILVTMCLIIALFVLTLTAQAQEKDGKRLKTYAGKQLSDIQEKHEWVNEAKNPTPWLNWGFDQRLRTIYTKNFLWLDNDSSAPENEWHFQRFRSRLWSTITPVENMTINTRLVWEWRNYCKPDSDARSGPIEWDEAIFDRMNVSFKNAFDLPIDITVGRQDIILGNGWLVLDGTPYDGSRTIFFDAAKVTYKISEAQKIDLIYIDQRGEADETIEPFNDQERVCGLAEQDERGFIFYLTDKSLIPDAEVNGYFIYKHDMPIDHVTAPLPSPTNDSHIYTAGARINGGLDDNWKYRAEFAQQSGQKNYQNLCALGFNSRVSYLMNDVWKNKFYTGYEYLSGDDPATKTNEAFDPLWGRWPQWSELYIYTYATETRIAETTNLHRIHLGWDCEPTEQLCLTNQYHVLFADENTLGGTGGRSNDSHFRGQLLTSRLTYKFNRHLSGHLLGEFFFPGDYYTDDRNDAAAFLRYELMLTF